MAYRNTGPVGAFLLLPMSARMESRLEQLKKQKEYYVTKIFWLGFEIALIFGIPAGLGAWLGTRLGGGTPLFLILGFTFIFSWIIVIIRFRSISKKIQVLENTIHEEELKSDDHTSR